MKRLTAHSGMALLFLAAVILAGPAVMWLVHDRDWMDQWVTGAMALAVTLSVALAGLVERELTRRRTESKEGPSPGTLSAELRERWCELLRADVTRTRVGEDGQLAKMVRQGDPIDQKTTRVAQDEGRPQVRVGGRPVAWSEITQRWDTALGRLVILGDPGYGKTVAALTLIKHINARSERGACVAELFPLSEWQRWRGEHQALPFGAWLAEQLTTMHAGLDAAVARELVDARLVLPVLDGLDEIATVEYRRACVAAIDAYAERGAPHRPFVLTCRAREYYELAPDWVRDDECVVLVGLQPDQIQGKLAEPQIAGRPAWNALREQQAAGDAEINELFRSPLRLAVALQVYHDSDPSELLELPVVQARERLWELLLAHNADGYRDATPAQVRAWLEWLASGMRRTGRQRFLLHELYLLDPEQATPLRAFRVMVALVFGLLAGLAGGLAVGELSGVLIGGLAAVLAGWLVEPAPSIRTKMSWRARVQHAREAGLGLAFWLGFGLAVSVVLGLAVALTGGFTDGLTGGALTDGLVTVLVGAPCTAALFALMDIGLLSGTHVIRADPPSRFAFGRPDAVLRASRTSGLTGALAGGLMGALGGILSGGLNGSTFTLVGAMSFALIWGLGAWTYHYWLRWRLRARGLLPPRLPEFLEWCTEDMRGWLRISDAYEFRHRELLEHLALTAPPAD